MNRSAGFTLIEMMVVVSLLAIISAAAAPGLRSFASGQRVKSLAADLNSDLLLVRSEALKRGTSLTLTPVGGNWHAGWTVTLNGTELLNRERTLESLQFNGAPSALTFNRYGRVAVPSTDVQITITSSVNSTQARCVELDLSGRARTKYGACT